MAHAKVRSLRHPNGGEEYEKGKRYGNKRFHGFKSTEFWLGSSNLDSRHKMLDIRR